MHSSERYTAASVAAAAVVMRQYSTSFSLASRMLPQRVRSDVTSIYALVRVADEIVDGAFTVEQREHLDALEAATERAVLSGLCANPVVHAFAHTARKTGFGSELTAPFFASMRADLSVTAHTPQSLAEYIYGSAEVVGLMCLRAFLHGVADADFAALADSARSLGSAFQKINFLRDLSEDEGRLGRCYLPELTADRYRAAVADARAELVAARRGIAALPADVQPGVSASARLYWKLADRLDDAGLSGARSGRVRVPAVAKLAAVIPPASRRAARAVRNR